MFPNFYLEIFCFIMEIFKSIILSWHVPYFHIFHTVLMDCTIELYVLFTALVWMQWEQNGIYKNSILFLFCLNFFFIIQKKNTKNTGGCLIYYITFVLRKQVVEIWLAWFIVFCVQLGVCLKWSCSPCTYISKLKNSCSCSSDTSSYILLKILAFFLFAPFAISHT